MDIVGLRIALLAGLLATPLVAHPGGHPGVGQHAVLTLDGRGVSVAYDVELGEMLTLGLIGELGLDDRVPPPVAAVETYRASHAARWLEQLVVRLDGEPVAWKPGAGRASVHPGIATFSTVRFELAARGTWRPLGPGRHKLTVRDDNFADVAGARSVEVQAAPDIRFSSVPVAGEREARAVFTVREIDPEQVPLSAALPVAARSLPPVAVGQIAAALALLAVVALFRRLR